MLVKGTLRFHFRILSLPSTFFAGQFHTFMESIVVEPLLVIVELPICPFMAVGHVELQAFECYTDMVIPTNLVFCRYV